ncbi:MAG: lysozyme [Rickettsiales bacterium]|jgi:lysozyme|nr:lysozyme [Rickettsiales bacterium]
MHISERGVQLIKSFEGYSLKTYTCPAGYKTIGYGHVIDKNIHSITRADADRLLAEDIYMAEKSVKRNIKVDLTQGQFDALVSFTFNLGGAALQRSTLRQKVNREEHQDAPKEFMRWVYAGGMVLAGLVKRREAEANIYAS